VTTRPRSARASKPSRNADRRKLSVDVTDATFSVDVVQRSHELPVVVDFWADWCAPCKALTPVLEREVAAREGVALAKVDVDANRAVAEHYGVRSIPAVKAFRNGKVLREFVGAQSPQMVEAFLDSLLGPSAGERLLDELRAAGGQEEAVTALETRDYERALELLLEQVREAEDAETRDRLRRFMLALFEELGQDDELATRYRRQLASALY
jgi:putative thioredoxin